MQTGRCAERVCDGLLDLWIASPGNSEERLTAGNAEPDGIGERQYRK